jgi:putative ABC transport system permease protein
MIVIGVVIGLAVSAGLSRVLNKMLFGVEPLDLVTFASVTVLVAVTGVVSIVGPAWRAIRIDPVVALREE